MMHPLPVSGIYILHIIWAGWDGVLLLAHDSAQRCCWDKVGDRHPEAKVHNPDLGSGCSV